jgi:uncharacterized protein (TIGR02145 family)
MLERGYIEIVEADGITTRKVSHDLTCDTENLLWEPVGEDVFEDCDGATITENLAEPGTYVYRAKLNFKAERDSDCPDCKEFVGNKFECFMITVMAGNENEGTFTDERDGKVYKWVKIGDQVWMAENLAWDSKTWESKIYSGYEKYGWWYTWDLAHKPSDEGGAAPDGWHLPTNAEWDILIDYLTAQNYGYEGDGNDVAKALASTSDWLLSPYAGSPGNDPESNNTSGFNGIPVGVLSGGTSLDLVGNTASWWTDDLDQTYPSLMGSTRELYYGNPFPYTASDYFSAVYHSVRCVRDAQ